MCVCEGGKVCAFVRLCVCLFKTHGGGSLWQRVHVGGRLGHVVWVCVCFSAVGVCA